MTDVRTARRGAVARESITREMQVTGTREVDLDGTIAMDVNIARARYSAFTSVASEAVSVAIDGFFDIAGT